VTRARILARLTRTLGEALGRGEPTGRERRVVARMLHRLMQAACVAGALVGAVLTGLWYPADGWLFDAARLHDSYPVPRAIQVGADLLGAATMLLSPAVRRHPVAAATFGIGVNGVLVGWGEAASGGLDTPWIGFLYLMPYASLPMICGLPQRVLAAFLAGGGAWIAFFMRRPEDLAHPAFSTVTAFQLFVAAGAVAFGELFQRLVTREALLRVRRRDRERELRRIRAGLETRVAEQTQRLAALAQEAQLARDEERRWIAREIHDSLGQQLSALRYVAHRVSIAADGEAGPAAADMDRLLGQAGASLRRVLDGLQPRAVEEMGLLLAIQCLVDEVRQGSSLVCELSVDAPQQHIPQDVSVALYRVCQEALANVTRHAKARRVRVDLVVRADEIRLSVGDDGVGLANADLPLKGYGIASIRDRVRALGGEVDWSPSENSGTCLTARVPLHRADAEPRSAAL